MSENNKWKDRLLSSSVPLEYEVAKVLIDEGFFVDFDYSYQRLDDTLEKEFSIDVIARGFSPLNNRDTIDIDIDILIECKYRNPDVAWVFLPNIEPEGTIGYLYNPIKVLDEFSETKLKSNNDEFHVPNITKKGIEVNLKNGEVHNTGILHGINQLYYAIPVLLSHQIKSSLVDSLEDVRPLIFCPILVTTADLRFFHENLSIENVKKSDNIDDISFKVPYLVYNLGSYPSFSKHCENIFKDIPAEDEIDRYNHFIEIHSRMIDSVDGYKNTNPDLRISTTKIIMDHLKIGSRLGYFDEILICNISELQNLILIIKENISKINASLTKLNKL